ncbi:hypothetical protein CRENBAI_013558 [Crenichthys baileyi]|uniref:Uncharacterized protein n=1 Tax=Crenichthys baileyi TaxID=28760 RepID=A0AAV9RLR8_9TELE
MGRLGKSLSHLLLGLSSSLESVSLDQSTQGMVETSLQVFALMTRELGQTLSTLVHARCQVWQAQSPLTEPCRQHLRALPVVSREVFGSAALEALEHMAQASRTQQQLAGLHRRNHQPLGSWTTGGLPRRSTLPSAPLVVSRDLAPGLGPSSICATWSASPWVFKRPGGPQMRHSGWQSDVLPRDSSTVGLPVPWICGCYPPCPVVTGFSSDAGLLSLARCSPGCVAAALSPLQAWGVRILPYLDDCLCCNPCSGSLGHPDSAWSCGSLGPGKEQADPISANSVSGHCPGFSLYDSLPIAAAGQRYFKPAPGVPA